MIGQLCPTNCIFAHFLFLPRSIQLEQTLRFDSGDGDHDSPESRSLAQQNVDLRRRLDEEQAAYKRKLTAYQEGQQRQAQLVQRLQAKVCIIQLHLHMGCSCEGVADEYAVTLGASVQEEVRRSGTNVAAEVGRV